ncbi:MAG: protein-glutamate O-methyltransferase CheR [Gallionellaceae bacterium]|nr:protein-glutamate O-methyltransferase CheR [Gallionellaceae bacterium]
MRERNILLPQPSEKTEIAHELNKSPTTETVEGIEIHLLLDGIFQRYGYDFRNYTRAALKSRVRYCMWEERVNSVSALQEKILYDAGCWERCLYAFSVSVTSMFRDAGFYLAFKEKVVPLLCNYPLVRIWHAGCASGEEVYSISILLHEAGLYEHALIYATDMNASLLGRASAGVYSREKMKEYGENYRQAQGKGALADYYLPHEEGFIFRDELKKNIIWAQHNLVSDSSFNEFQVILCCNVLIYFDRVLQTRVHKLLYESLAPGGMLGLAGRESTRFSPYAACYEEMDAIAKWVRRIG